MIGKTIGYFWVIDKLGEGGKGALCRATLGRLFALKALAPSRAKLSASA